VLVELRPTADRIVGDAICYLICGLFGGLLQIRIHNVLGMLPIQIQMMAFAEGVRRGCIVLLGSAE
jgi:hypothetical protein